MERKEEEREERKEEEAICLTCKTRKRKRDEVEADDDDEDKYLSSFPPGYRFSPNDQELVESYLMKKVNNEALPRNKIQEVTLYLYNPEDLTAMYKHCGDEEWFFFTSRDRKYWNGHRPNRAAGNGYWKATGAVKNVIHKGKLIGFRNALVFYIGKPPKGKKTDWIMHEYTVNYDHCSRTAKTENSDHMRLDDCVLCKIYQKAKGIRRRAADDQGVIDEEVPVSNEREEVPVSNETDSSVTFGYNDMSSSYMDFTDNMINTEFFNPVHTAPFDQSLPYALLPYPTDYQYPPFSGHFPTMDNIGFESENHFNASEFPITDIYSTMMNIPFEPVNQAGLFDPNSYMTPFNHVRPLQEDSFCLKQENYVFPQVNRYDQNIFLDLPIANVGENPFINPSIADDDSSNPSGINDDENPLSSASETWTSTP